MSRALIIGVLCALAGVVSGAQQPASPAFEIVAIKPNTALDRSGMISSPVGTQFRVSNIPLRMIITYAYNLRDLELIDAPGWTSDDRFDITATYPVTASHTLEEARQMMRGVLAERFGLRVHEDMREMPMYRLVRARDDGTLGPKLIQVGRGLCEVAGGETAANHRHATNQPDGCKASLHDGGDA